MDLIIRNVKERVDKYYQFDEIQTLQDTPIGIRDILFVTSNEHKVRELSNQLQVPDLNLSNVNLDLPEIQDIDPLVIAQDKCHRAFQQVNKNNSRVQAVVVEDVCLNFNAMNGLPGPYIKWFVDSIKPIGLYNMLAAFEDKSAEAICTYALMENETKIVFCRGTVKGFITEPRGESWGWDPVFEDPKSGLTFAEMDEGMKSKCSHRASAIRVLKEYLSVEQLR